MGRSGTGTCFIGRSVRHHGSAVGEGVGFGKKSDQYAEISSQTIDSLREFVGFEKVELRDHRVIKQDPRVQLDGGAVAKGQACDMIADLLARNGCTNYLVDIGGEVVCHGMNPRGERWHIGITKPNLNNEGAQQDLHEVLAVSDVCMATSGNYRNFYYVGDERRSHTIDLARDILCSTRY